MQKVKLSIQSEQTRWRMWFWTVCELFVLYSMLHSLHSGPVSDALVCLLVGIGVAVPYILEAFGYRMSDILFVFSLLYLLASMSGRIYKLYYLVAHWDKLLHLCGGVLFALMFSISVSALWEFYEFGMDRWFGMDMQRDTIIHAIHSYDLGEVTGVIGSIDQIDSVIVNGEPLEGYIDIGLIDTMGDMMIETAGAAAYAVVFALDKGRHPAFIHAAMASLPEKKPVHAQAE